MTIFHEGNVTWQITGARNGSNRRRFYELRWLRQQWTINDSPYAARITSGARLANVAEDLEPQMSLLRVNTCLPNPHQSQILSHCAFRPY